ncbi:dTDP-4-dehydrorhamnose reductase [Jiangella asiatica]|uniref:dTDP-4-dehydrorhamnose reductase n=1 Tax=Jiangella asiatica TaxID=2530372 RepID=A0A4R5DNK3_9ACTN|nr:dTDP-4-dehydrorhamnose reductase [Jiangella asiatica]TDE15912.1 dTDP-4-dehydrorhamnose reductase [Jiangella asiatica]
MRWLVTGAAGMLGHDLVTLLTERDMKVTAARRDQLDVTDAAAVDDAVSGHDVVVNAAAWTDVDAAESDETAAFAVNGTAPGLLAAACARHGARLVHVSTDYVFDGQASEPYPEDAPTAPRSAYGRTKLAGERAVLSGLPDAVVVRTAWLYGQHGRNFVATMARLAASRDHVDVVDDQRGQPTWSHDLAQRVVELIDAGAPGGAYHATNSGSTTWFGLARAVFTHLGLDPSRVRPTTTEAFPRPAPRPAYSVLGHDGWARAGLGPMRPWEDALAAAAPVVLHQGDAA